MSRRNGTLFFFCGKMAAGKSTLARELAATEKAVLLAEDHFLERLFPDEITDVAAYVRCSTRIREALSEHITALLSIGLSVVLDFPGNTRRQRGWFRELIERADVEHQLHFVDAPDSVCLRQLGNRSRELASGTLWTSDDEFHAITAYFEPPAADERFNVVRHERTSDSTG
jgi:predicted kinase